MLTCNRLEERKISIKPYPDKILPDRVTKLLN
jgi:hypothetical protein